MLTLFAPLLPLPNATEAQRWRLVTTIFGPATVMLEGGGAHAMVLGLAWARTGDFAMIILTVASLAMIGLRAYWRDAMLKDETRRQQGHKPARTPEDWANLYAAGLNGSAVLWGLTCLRLARDSGDPKLTVFAVMAEAVWMTNGAIRSIACPRAARGVAFASVLPTLAGVAPADDPILLMIVPAALIQLSALWRATSRMGADIAAAIAVERAMEETNEELSRLTNIDGLTGLLNRRAFDAALAREWAGALREKRPLSILMIDVDHFKAFNDLYGHPAGDGCLRLIAGRLRGCLQRPRDAVARYGGEEFVAILPDTDLANARRIAGDMRAAVTRAAIAHGGAPAGVVSVSVGVACSDALAGAPGDILLSPGALLAAADRALYAAKQGGRNCVRVMLSAEPVA